jgi:hypothetical protein
MAYIKGKKVLFANVNLTTNSEPIQTEAKTVTPSNETQVIRPGPLYGGLSEVTVFPIPASYNREGWPIQVATSEEMDAILANDNTADYGKVYKYTGETNNKYVHNAHYVLEADETEE